MPNNSLSPSGPPVPPRSVIDALMRLIRDQVPGFALGMVVTSRILNQIADVIKRNLKLLGAGLTSAGLVVLIPSLCVAIVNALGFTASGVLAGSIAAAIQSSIYGASTAGIFSILQSFGATAVIASPIGLALGGISLVAGVGFFAYWLYKRRSGDVLSNNGNDDDDDGPSDADPSENNAVAKRSSSFNFFDLFSRNSKEKSD